MPSPAPGGRVGTNPLFGSAPSPLSSQPGISPGMATPPAATAAPAAGGSEAEMLQQLMSEVRVAAGLCWRRLAFQGRVREGGSLATGSFRRWDYGPETDRNGVVESTRVPTASVGLLWLWPVADGCWASCCCIADQPPEERAGRVNCWPSRTDICLLRHQRRNTHRRSCRGCHVGFARGGVVVWWCGGRNKGEALTYPALSASFIGSALEPW